MEFQNDAAVYTGDGVKIGRIGWVVIDPTNKDITHIIVKQGFMFDDDKVIPFGAVENATADRVTLRAGLDPHSFPDFDDVDYVPTEIEDANRPNQSVPSLLSYQPIAGIPLAGLILPFFIGGSRPREPMHPETDPQNLPEGAVALKVGAKVLSADGIHIGDVERIYTKGGHASHILISHGAAKAIPVKWISAIEADTIRLSVGSKTLQNLPDQIP